MPDQPKTQHRSVRIDDDLWDELGRVAEPDRATVIRDLIRWYLRRPKARLPERPGSGHGQ